MAMWMCKREGQSAGVWMSERGGVERQKVLEQLREFLYLDADVFEEEVIEESV